MTAKWKLNRAGLFNFWYYDNEVFEFEDGKLLLRGTNGSGKSVTMQSLLPVLLDGKKSPDRLDPFGSRSRRMADYLLGEKEVSDRDERTGYLYVEYKMSGTEQYLTTGMGMQAKRNQPLKSWGFVITDNRRIGQDFQLYKQINQNGEKKAFPLSQTELTTQIGAGGEVVASNLEYMKLVNRHIFGFETIEAYDDLIKLLIQLRSPKLSKDFKPTVIYEILEEALPPLTDEDLRYLSDSIEQMDQTKQQMEQMEREVKALARLKEAYEAYSERILADQAKEWKQAEERSRQEERDAGALAQQLEELGAELSAGRQRERELAVRQGVLSEQYKRLHKHEIFQLEEELQLKQRDQQELERELKDERSRVEAKQRREREAQRRLADLEERADRQEKALRDAVEELDYEAETCAFAQHELNVQDYERNEGGPFAFDNWKREIEAHTVKLEAALEELKSRDVVIRQIQDKNRELGEEKRAHDELLHNEDKWRRLLFEEKQALVHRIHLWLDEHDWYPVPDGAKQQMMRLMDDLFFKHEYEEVKGQFLPYVQEYEDGLRNRRAELSSDKAQAVKERDALQEQWKQMKAQRDPEPVRHAATVEARQKLEEAGVAYKPLYELVEFKPEVPAEVQRRLESALTETGLLDALVTTRPVEFRHDRLLADDPKLFTATLADYLQPDEAQKTIPAGRIEAILQSIEMNGDAPVYFSEDGRYRMGSLQGHALPLEEVRFIGREARRRYREQLLAELESRIAAQEERIAGLEEKLRQVEGQWARSREAWSRFPSAADVRTCYNELDQVLRELKLRESRIHELGEQLAGLDRQLQDSKRKLVELTRGVGLEWKADAYQQALGMSRQYEKRLNAIEREHDQWMRLLADQVREREQLRELQEETDELKGRLNGLEDKAAKLEQQIAHIRQQQELKGAEDVRREIREVYGELTRVEGELKELANRLPRLEANQAAAGEKLQEKQSLLQFWRQMSQAWKEALRKEWKRGAAASASAANGAVQASVAAKTAGAESAMAATARGEAVNGADAVEPHTDAAERVGLEAAVSAAAAGAAMEAADQDGVEAAVSATAIAADPGRVADAAKLAKSAGTDATKLASKAEAGAGDREEPDEAALRRLADLKPGKERSVLEGQLTSLFYSLQPDLTEHHMNLFTDSPDWPGWMKEVTREEWKPVVEQWKTRTTRNLVEFDQRGVKIPPSVLYDTVARELSIQETRLDDLDKKLYEDILLNSVGHKLRGRIRRAEQWTEKMRGLMENRNTSSGLKFSIRWKPRTADSEAELDTQDLVALLKQDANLLNEWDLERITRHFRSKIQSAKTWLEEKGEGQTLLQVLKMVLDYRKWFSFVLFYERPNEPRRELTNHHFFKFSGGEKAMAMYIPLFTACYSRYLEAAPSAPYIISLDEAFAGVDENNINEMFEIVEQLGFNYIMNSQVLWGDYETVKALSVCELIRPKNADYVTVIRYKWNGRELALHTGEEGIADGEELAEGQEAEGSAAIV